MATHPHHAPGSDKAPAFIGLIGGIVVLGALLYGIVVWTNGKYAGHGEAKGPAAGQVAH